MTQSFDEVLDARGLACPMPLVKARQSVKALAPGKVLKVLATDRGSVKDFQGWAKAARDIELVAQSTESAEGKEIFVHLIRRTA
jgi:TusA-related sulfurtransferase